MKNKLKTALIVVFVVAATLTSLSVTGLLQSTERFISSGIVVRPPPPPIMGGGGGGSPTPPPPEPLVEIDVFSDNACTQKVTEVPWGEIFAGNSKSITIFVKNMGDVGVVLSLNTDDWAPSNAPDYIALTWNYDGSPIAAGSTKELAITLRIDEDCPELPGFSFVIVIVAS